MSLTHLLIDLNDRRFEIPVQQCDHLALDIDSFEGDSYGRDEAGYCLSYP